MKKLEIGPIHKKIDETWDTLDLEKRPYVDFNSFDEIGNVKFDLVYASHVLEHIPWYDVLDFLKDIKNILKPGGIVELWVPDFKKIVEYYENPEIINDWIPVHVKKQLDGFDKYTRFMWVLGRMFCYKRGETEGNFHKGAFDEEHLRYCLEQSGFKNIKKLEKSRGYDHGWINLGLSGEK